MHYEYVTKITIDFFMHGTSVKHAGTQAEGQQQEILFKRTQA